ncbi:MAG: DUF1848 domain-containing protein [Lachnospiraceae bacterium]|nr:DUF1848 domain-containing protein [Lachnospiraceae bacterium]
MIISASRKTDIPAYYSEWFINRIREGFVYSRNPLNAHQVSRIPLDPEVIDCIVFWTKNPIPMLKWLDELKDFKYYFQFTLTGYGKDMEANLPDKKEKLIPAFKELSDKIGSEKVIWRYDPIAFNEKYTPEYHLRACESIAKALKGYTEKCVISFVDVYQKIQKNMTEMHITEASDETMYSFAKQLYDIATDNDMVIATCAERIDLSSIGIEHNACIDRGVIERICGGKLKAKKDPSQRGECQCVESREIGSYNTCANGCRYCYANHSPEAVKANMAKYDPDSPILCDEVSEEKGDKITEVKAKSNIDRQMSLF